MRHSPSKTRSRRDADERYTQVEVGDDSGGEEGGCESGGGGDLSTRPGGANLLARCRRIRIRRGTRGRRTLVARRGRGGRGRGRGRGARGSRRTLRQNRPTSERVLGLISLARKRLPLVRVPSDATFGAHEFGAEAMPRGTGAIRRIERSGDSLCHGGASCSAPMCAAGPTGFTQTPALSKRFDFVRTRSNLSETDRAAFLGMIRASSSTTAALRSSTAFSGRAGK